MLFFIAGYSNDVVLELSDGGGNLAITKMALSDVTNLAGKVAEVANWRAFLFQSRSPNSATS